MKRWLVLLAVLALPALVYSNPDVKPYGGRVTGAQARDSVLYYADSLAAGDSITTPKIPIFGSTAVIFYWGHQDTTAGFRLCYSDSFASGGVQFSNDGTNWSIGVANTDQGFLSITMRGATVSNRPFGVTNTNANPGTTVGGGNVTAAFGTASTSGPPSFIPLRFARFKATNQTRVRQGGTGNAPVYRPWVRAVVIYNSGVPDHVPTWTSNP